MLSTRDLVLLCHLLLFYLSLTETSSNDDYTCVAGNFTVGRPGSVTCHFGPDVRKSGYHFEIVRYPFQAAASHSGEDVLRCHRLGGEIECITGKGYTFDEQIEDNLTISIPNVTHNQAGHYACQLIPPGNRKKRLCVLNVQDAEPIPESLLLGEKSSDTVLVLAVFVGILAVVCIIIALLFVFRNNRRRARLKGFFRPSREKQKNAANENKRKSSTDEKEQESTPFIMPPIVPYPESEVDSEPGDNNEKKEFDGDEDDAKQKYNVDISLNYKVDYYNPAGESMGKRRYSGDEQDKGRKAVQITIEPYDESKDTGQQEQKGSDPPWGINRRPKRHALPRSSAGP